MDIPVWYIYLHEWWAFLMLNPLENLPHTMEDFDLGWVSQSAFLPNKNPWILQVPVKGGIGSIFYPPGSARTISGI